MVINGDEYLNTVFFSIYVYFTVVDGSKYALFWIFPKKEVD